MRKSKTLLALLVALIMIFCSACGSAGTTQSAPASMEPESPAPAAEEAANTDAEPVSEYEVEVLRLGDGVDRGAPNPFRRNTDGIGMTRTSLIFDTLLQYGETAAVPWLAEYTIGEDQKSFTFTINPNATWHDGVDVTSEDIGFTLDYYKQFPDTSNYLGTDENYLVDSYEIVDEDTIIVHMKNVSTTNIQKFCNVNMIPKHVWEKVDDPYTYDGEDAFIGCGMYKLLKYDGATGVYQYEAYEDYYGHKPGAHYIDVSPVSDQVLSFNAGDVDIINCPPDLFDTYSNTEGVSIFDASGSMGYRLAINFDAVPELKDFEVRKALFEAIDRQAIADSVFRGFATPASAGSVPQDTPFYTDEVAKYEFDTEAAKAVLEPLNLKLDIIISDDGSGTTTAIAEMVKMNWEAAGVTVTVSPYESQIRYEKITKGEYQIALQGNGGWNTFPETIVLRTYSDTLRATPNARQLCSSNWSNPELTAIVDGLSFIMDDDARMEAYHKAQIMASEELQVLPLVTVSTYFAFNSNHYNGWQKNVQNVTPTSNLVSFTSDHI